MRLLPDPHVTSKGGMKILIHGTKSQEEMKPKNTPKKQQQQQ